MQDEVLEMTNKEDVDLSSFELKDKLNEKIWNGDKLNILVRRKLLSIAKDFISDFDIADFQIEDVIMTGSLANFNWDENYSDIDLHIVVDFNENSEDRIGYVNAKHNGQILATMIIVQEGWYSILEASLTEIEARPEGGEYVIQVTANQSWSVNTTENWIHCTPNSGFSNGEFTITVDAMEGVRPRMGRIKLGGSTGDQVMIMVNQHP
jgi:hypothetical protein